MIDEDELYASARSAFQAAFMWDIPIKNAEGKWILNPELEPILRDLAANDPDEEIQKKSARALTFDYTSIGEKKNE